MTCTTRTTTNRSFARHFSTAATLVALTAGLATAGPTLEPEKMPETAEPDSNQATHSIDPVLRTGDDLTAAGWTGWRVEGLSSADHFAISPDGTFWLTTIRVSNDFGEHAELLVRGQGSELQIVGSTYEPMAGQSWDDLNPIDVDNAGAGNTEASRKYFSRDDLQKIDEEQTESTVLKVNPYERHDGALRTDGTTMERMDESDVQPIAQAEPTVQWTTAEYEYMAYQEGEVQGVFRQQRTAATCPADFNGDSYADSGDITAFIHAFLNGSRRADLNHDGVIDGGDLNRFVARFIAGC